MHNGLYCLSSKLGWILTGRTAELDDTTYDTSMLGLTYGMNIRTQVFTSIEDAVSSKPELEYFEY